MERVIVTLPRDLLDEIDKRAQRLSQKRSRVVRQALQEWVERQRREEFEALMAEGYQEMAAQLAGLAEETLPLVAEATEGIWRWDD